ncbi:hypothetical protein HGM15179_021183 [Zosterops borbonicus]|uniref:Uncharacterized protein n=1 Tax=Zosterops borbonicus TaxID=364589 RepID=A0A8K1D7T5_9PASS|nr:hypothetical protein HGM15179_021183 [Zosterops borbonicus]
MFLSPKGSQVSLKPTAQTPSSFTVWLPDGSIFSFGSAAQGSHAVQESQVPTPQTGGRETPKREITFGNEVITSQEEVEKPQIQTDSGMGEATSALQAQQLTPMSEESQVSDAQISSATDLTEIKKKALKEFNLTATRSLALTVTYDAQGQNPRWEQLDHDVIKELVKAIRDNRLECPYFKQVLKGTFNI